MIISDRDKLFISDYWKILILLLEIRLRLFIAYHSKTNRQLGKKIRVLNSIYMIISIINKTIE